MRRELEVRSSYRGPSTSPVIEIEELRKTYGEGEASVEAIRGIDLKVNEGGLSV